MHVQWGVTHSMASQNCKVFVMNGIYDFSPQYTFFTGISPPPFEQKCWILQKKISNPQASFILWLLYYLSLDKCIILRVLLATPQKPWLDCINFQCYLFGKFKDRKGSRQAGYSAQLLLAQVFQLLINMYPSLNLAFVEFCQSHIAMN